MSRRALVVLILAGIAAACSAGEGEEDAFVDESSVRAGETVPELGPRIDRIGRPEVTNFVIRDPALKEKYNAEDSFAIDPAMRATYAAAMKAAIAHYDAMDGKTDYDDAKVGKLVSILIDDHLRIDTTKSCSVLRSGYFAVERGEITGERTTSCGGRTPNEDVFDDLITFYTNGPSRALPRVSDGVDGSTGPAVASFPYLSRPHLLRPRSAQ